MTIIAPPQIKLLQAICSGKFSSREERLEFFSEFLDKDITTTKELTKEDADDLITYFKTGRVRDNTSFALFNKNNKKHLKILSLAKELDWVDPSTEYADLNRLGGWIKSNKCPVQGKKLNEMSYNELSKVIKAMENMIQSKWK